MAVVVGNKVVVDGYVVGTVAEVENQPRRYKIAQEVATMRNNRIVAIVHKMNDIEASWQSRNVVDATAEEEFELYEACLYAFAEFVCVQEVTV